MADVLQHSLNHDLSNLIWTHNTVIFQGAFIWSCNALVSEIKASQKEFEGMLQEHRKGRGKTHTHGYYGGLNPRPLGSTPKAWANPTNTPLGVVFSAMISSPIVGTMYLCKSFEFG